MRDRRFGLRFPQALMLVLVAAAFVNAALYIHVAANPLIASDEWYFLDAFLREAINGSLGLGDFLVKRAGLDHSQPLGKLLLLFHYHYFDLDYTVEAWIGLLFAFFGFAVLYRIAVDGLSESARPAFFIAMAAIAATYVSLNSSQVFTYSLLTLAYSILFLVFASIHGAWKVLSGRSVLWLGVPFLALGIAADNVAAIAAVALLATTAFIGWRMGRSRSAWTAALAIVGVLIASRVFLMTFGEIRGTTQAVFNVGVAQRLQGLWAGADASWQWLLIPASASIAWTDQLKYYFGPDWETAQIVLGAVVLLAQVWFWLAASRTKPSSALFAAICIMWVGYGLWAGILYGRVFARGAEYLQQPRYVLFYQLDVIALLMMGIARVASSTQTDPAQIKSTQPDRRKAFIAIALAIIAVQIPLSWSSWAGTPFQLKYYQRMATQLQQLAQDPGTVPAGCVPILVVCQMPVAQRTELVRLLQSHHLNLFSPDFQRRHPELSPLQIPR